MSKTIQCNCSIRRVKSKITLIKFNLIDFIKFLSSMIFGNTKEKAILSFKFLDKKGRKRIGEN